jgi:aminoglycoside phosphotransferase (APT) family kinase protein
MPAAEVDVDAGLVSRLVAEQFPHLGGVPVTPVRSVVVGWDNALFRVGTELVARLPRRQLGADLVAKEQLWLPQLALHLPAPIPVPLHRGVPGAGYPWAWTICEWFPGEPALAVRAEVTDWVTIARQLGAFLAALHRPAPRGAPVNQWRSGPLSRRNTSMRERLAALDDVVDVGAVQSEWDEVLRLPEWDGEPVWVHGDLHGGNVLVEREEITAVLDWGDLSASDPAVDLIIAWAVLPAAGRAILREEAGVGVETWARGRGWALALGVVYVAYSLDNPLLGQMGHRMIKEILLETQR